MAFPNAFHGGMGGPNFPGPFPNRMNQPPFNLRVPYNGFGPGFDDHLRRLAFYRDADVRARFEFRDCIEPLPPGIDPNWGIFPDRDRLRERDLEMRNREERDHGRDRRRSDYDRDRGREGDWVPDRDAAQPGRSDRSDNRDRSPVHSVPGSSDSEIKTTKYEANDKDYDVVGDDERSNGSSSERFRSRETDSHVEGNRPTDDKGGDKWVCNVPSRTIILRNLHVDVDEKIIGDELTLLGLPVKDIRLIRRSSGVSRGFAFVEFHNVADAQRWMEYTQVDNADK
uniref:RRM domain-containing protein n=1 Tax=Arion vulgaris TaxID=1028688 RepID=A0A0B7ALU5_9EUPU